MLGKRRRGVAQEEVSEQDSDAPDVNDDGDEEDDPVHQHKRQRTEADAPSLMLLPSKYREYVAKHAVPHKQYQHYRTQSPADLLQKLLNTLYALNPPMRVFLHWWLDPLRLSVELPSEHTTFVCLCHQRVSSALQALHRKRKHAFKQLDELSSVSAQQRPVGMELEEEHGSEEDLVRRLLLYHDAAALFEPAVPNDVSQADLHSDQGSSLAEGDSNGEEDHGGLELLSDALAQMPV